MNEPNKDQKSKKIIAPREERIDPLLRLFADVCRGLVFISETDAEFEPFIAGKARSTSLSAYVNELRIDDRNLEEVSFDKFFERLTTEKDWHRDLDKKRIRKFSKLRKVLQSKLEDLRVIRTGRIRIDIYVVGVDENGRLAGVKTKAIET